MRSGFNIVIGAQAGSESKGKLSAYLTGKHMVDALTMAASPNAGHTLRLGGERYVSYHIPVCAVMDEGKGDDLLPASIYLGPTSLIRPAKLDQEIRELGISRGRIMVHPRAAIIDDTMVRQEEKGGLSDIGSTLQGVGATRTAKMQRDGSVHLAQDFQVALERSGVVVGDTTADLNTLLEQGATVLHECTQGFDLDLEHGIHPNYCTSKMINPAMAMAEMGVSPWFLGDVYGCLRPFPIRVNNRTGWSGPYPGTMELTWSQVAQNCGYPGDPSDITEYTTTTKLPRRVFTFSWERFQEFFRVCRPDFLCLQFANYVSWTNYGARDENQLTEKTIRFISELERCGSMVAYVGTGPEHEDMVDRGRDGGRSG
jgi:adenylosuccinate synthase